MADIQFELSNWAVASQWDQQHSILILIDDPTAFGEAIRSLPQELASRIEKYAKEKEWKPKAGKSLSFDAPESPKVAVALLPKKNQAFSFLEWARKQTSGITSKADGKALVLVAKGDESRLLHAVDAIVSAVTTARFQMPQFKSKKKKEKNEKVLVKVCVQDADDDKVSLQIDEAVATATGTNLVRQLAMLPGNVLTPTIYRKKAEELAGKNGLSTEWISLSDLRKMGAGAFEAVAKGATDPGSGILKVKYGAKNAKTKIAIVGKGLCYDTGGFNLKTGHYMYGMNDDMTGSAVALALAITAKTLELPIAVTAYLALTENILSPQAYRPNDLVKTLLGKTIEVVDTDAEGRMVLADTLTLAGREKPDLILDFATLTGACIRALGTLYSGAYSNKRSLYSLIRGAGQRSGERVWPFPNDADYGRCLKSEVADIKQCRESGGVDHIEAGYFLSQFVPKTVPWIHVDLSAGGNEGGLGHVGTKTTGFGVRYGVEVIKMFMQRGL